MSSDNMVCTFFGHRDAPESVGEKLEVVLIDLIENKGVDLFYVGNQGNFDFIVRKKLQELKKEYPYITYLVVLAYLPKSNGITDISYENSVYPEGLENVPPKYAIDKRNRWMIDRADYVIVYVKYNFGGAIRFSELAQRKGKTVLNLV